MATHDRDIVDKMKKRVVPTRNYVVVFIISIITMIALVLFSVYYKNQKKYENEMNQPMGFLAEINSEELDNYIVENHSIMIYISNSTISDDNIQNEVRNQVEKNNYSQDIIYLDMKDLTEDFYERLAKTYFDKDLTNTNIVTNSILFVKDGIIVDILNIDEKNVKTLSKYIEREFYK